MLRAQHIYNKSYVENCYWFLIKKKKKNNNNNNNQRKLCMKQWILAHQIWLNQKKKI